MNGNQPESLIQKLVQAAYDSGYYSGKEEIGQPHHKKAIVLREQMREKVLKYLKRKTQNGPQPVVNLKLGPIAFNITCNRK